MRSAFQSPDELNDFFQEHSDPQQSPVYQATEQAVDYVASMPGITSNTRLLTVILSDMNDSETNRQARSEAGQKMIASLKRYQELGGGMAFYFVDSEETARWQRIMNMAEFEPGTYVIQNSVVASPQLPRFD